MVLVLSLGLLEVQQPTQLKLFNLPVFFLLQAFRQLSHRFHGKGSGKMKTERRMKKLDEEAVSEGRGRHWPVPVAWRI